MLALALLLSAPSADLPLNLRRGQTVVPEVWNAAQTAVVVCDVWDRHWCPEATARVGAMVPRLDAFLAEARRRGALIIHCPSDTLGFYADAPQRRRAQDAPKLERPLGGWCYRDPAAEPALPIDDAAGGCESAVPQRRAWTRQHPGVAVAPEDAVAEGDEPLRLMRARGVDRALIVGVHTNMCVLGRPFGIRRLVAEKVRVALVRDLTDTMYDPAKAPFVSHFTGTDLVVGHIEKYFCPTCTSADLLGGREFRFPKDARPTLCVAVAEDEYRTAETLPAFALAELGRDYRVRFVHAPAARPNDLAGLDAELASADALVLSVRRRPLPPGQLGAIRAFLKAGKPLVALRTSSHAFAPRKGEPVGRGLEAWPAFDREALGVTYAGHHPQRLGTLARLPGADAEARFTSWLYRSENLDPRAEVLAMGRAGDARSPLAWRWRRPDGGRTFYTSLGHPDDFKDEGFRRLLRENVRWATGG